MSTTASIPSKDLTKEAPTSPRVRTGGYAILARMADKGRAVINGKVGEYHFNCPLDNMLFGFKGVNGEDVKALLEKGASNDEVAAWLDKNGTPKTQEEIKQWADGIEAYSMHGDPEKGAWFDEQVNSLGLGLDPAKTTLFTWLEGDDKVSFKK